MAWNRLVAQNALGNGSEMTAAGRRYCALGVLFLLSGVLVVGVLLHRQPVRAAVPPAAVPVAVAKAVVRDMHLTITGLGSAQAWTSDTVFSQVSGKLLRVDFVEGADVEAGQLLAEVDPRSYQAVLAQAEGALARDRAVLAGARVDLERYRSLMAADAIALKLVGDQAALVAQDEGTVQVDEGAVAVARINLAYCRITSPVSGRAGVRLVDPGNLVTAGGSVASTPSTAAATNSAAATGTSSGGSSGSGIVVINQIQPIAVTFTVPEGQFQRLQAISNGFVQPFSVQAYSQETGALLDSGELSIADNRVDPATGTVELKAKFPNAGRRLWAGQFVNVKLVLSVLHNATVIPSAAVYRGPNGQFAFVVGADRRAVARPVTLTGTEGSSAIVKSGLRAGELVVTDGQMTLQNGSLIRVAEIAPTADAAP